MSDYKIISELGRGGMGVVYEALQTQLGRTVALKVLSTQFAGDPSSVARFHREVRACAALSHPNVIRVYDSGEKDGQLYFAMELIQALTLQEWVRENVPTPLDTVTSLGRQLLEAVSHCHDHGLIHRDIKPGNVMVGTDGTLTLMDFGLVGSSNYTAITATGQIMGTPRYMAPEILAGGDTTKAADVWAVGVTLYHMITGGHPFEGKTLEILMNQVITVEATPLAEIRPDIPPALADFVAALLEKNPERRLADGTKALHTFRDQVLAQATPAVTTVKEPRRSRPSSLSRKVPHPRAEGATPASKERGTQISMRTAVGSALAIAIMSLVPLPWTGSRPTNTVNPGAVVIGPVPPPTSPPVHGASELPEVDPVPQSARITSRGVSTTTSTVIGVARDVYRAAGMISGRKLHRKLQDELAAVPAQTGPSQTEAHSRSVGRDWKRRIALSMAESRFMERFDAYLSIESQMIENPDIPPATRSALVQSFEGLRNMHYHLLGATGVLSDLPIDRIRIPGFMPGSAGPPGTRPVWTLLLSGTGPPQSTGGTGRVVRLPAPSLFMRPLSAVIKEVAGSRRRSRDELVHKLGSDELRLDPPLYLAYRIRGGTPVETIVIQAETWSATPRTSSGKRHLFAMRGPGPGKVSEGVMRIDDRVLGREIVDLHLFYRQASSELVSEGIQVDHLTMYETRRR